MRLRLGAATKPSVSVKKSMSQVQEVESSEDPIRGERKKNQARNYTGLARKSRRFMATAPSSEKIKSGNSQEN
jgi:hypothetical protein